MATLQDLKLELRQKAASWGFPIQPLTDEEYSDGFEIFMRHAARTTYRDFIIPQLTQLLTPPINNRDLFSILEIGPGPESVLEHLPIQFRRKIRAYTAFEPNSLVATRLEDRFCSNSDSSSLPFPCLSQGVEIQRRPFVLEDAEGGIMVDINSSKTQYDIILFCHSMYGMEPKHE